MQGFSESIRSAAEELEGIENEREAAIAGSRRVIRLSKRTIHAYMSERTSPDLLRR